MSLLARRRAMMGTSELVPNFIEIGTPNIVNGILYPTASGGIRLPMKFPPEDTETWEIYCEFVYSSRVTTGYQTLFSGSDKTSGELSNPRFGMYVDKSMVRARITDTDGTIVIGPGQTIGITQNAETKIARLLFTGTQYRYRVDGDGKNGTSSNYVPPQYLLIGYPNPFGGSINLKTFKIYRNGKV